VQLLLSSGNAKKLRELRALLEPLGIDLLTPADVGGLDEVVEDLPTFAGNAAKKATAAATSKGHWALADDSGLEVDALDGAPGVLSARFAGVHGDDDANNRLLLERLAGLPEAERGARFVCALALSRPDGTLAAQIEGTARGRILEAPRGDGDFGYDPLFLFTEPGHDATGRGFAELSPEEKSVVSHRGRALRALASQLQALFAESA
jgi:XTP/dITP diphosphohydrolase